MTIFSKMFGLDLRSLAAFRVGFGVFVLYDLATRALDLTAHYTDAGVLPRAFATLYHSGSPIYDAFSPVLTSVHMAAGSTAGIATIFALHALAALGLIVGYRTRLMTFVVWFLLASLHTRNPLVLSVGDDVARVIAFFSIFLPLGARYSIDAAMKSNREEATTAEMVAGPATAAFYVQFISIYFFSALLKNAPEWHSEATALYYAFNLDQFALPFAKTLLHFPSLLRVLTHTAWWLELLAGFLLLVPHPAGKTLGIVLIGGLQVGIGLTLALGHNPWINTIALIPFLPSWVWNRKDGKNRVQIIYDGDCGFCRKLVLIVVEFVRPRLITAPQAARGHDLATLRRENSWIVRNDTGKEFFRFDAFIQVIASSPLFAWKAPLLRFKPIHAIGTAVYRWVAANRNLLGKLISPIGFRKVHFEVTRFWQAIALLLVIAVVVYNAAWVMPVRSFREYIELPILALRLEQYWGMFAPAPNRDDGWFVIEGRLRSGTKVDVFREGKELDYSKPISARLFYKNERWRRYMMNLGTRALQDFRAPFAGYLCRTWNGKNSGPNHLEHVTVNFMQEVTPPPGGQANVQKLILGEYACAP